MLFLNCSTVCGRLSKYVRIARSVKYATWIAERRQGKGGQPSSCHPSAQSAAEHRYLVGTVVLLEDGDVVLCMLRRGDSAEAPCLRVRGQSRASEWVVVA